MKRCVPLTVVALAIVLAACQHTSPTTVSYAVTLRAPDAARTMELTQAVERVMVRKMAALNIQGARASAVPTGSGTATLTVDVPYPNAAKQVQALTEEQFTVDLRVRKTQEKSGQDTYVPEDWQRTTITGTLLVWVKTTPASPNAGAGVELEFTDEGARQLQSLFRENLNRTIGIFVRDLLVSKLTVKNASVDNVLTISGIPSTAIAQVFADDVNVGLHTSYRFLH